METNKIKLGDTIKIEQGYHPRLDGIQGKVIQVRKSNDGDPDYDEIFFEMKERHGWAHTCNGKTKEGHGYKLQRQNLVFISEATKPVVIEKYAPGQSIKDYICKIMKKETNKDRRKWLRTFDNCVLPDRVKKVIDESLTVVLRKDVFDEWGLNTHFEKGITNSILIYGPPGTGKTMISESIAAVLGKNLMKITVADIQSSKPGQAERNLTESFEKAKNNDAVIMLDECDSLLYDRDAVGAIMSAEINHLLGEIERFEGVVILTTNRLKKLDSALQRRIIAKVELGLPTKEAREQIWEKLIPPQMPTDKVDYKKLADPAVSGGEIKNAILLAARKAIAQNDKKVTMTHFTDALDNVVKSQEDYLAVRPKKVSDRVYSKVSTGSDYDKIKGGL